MRQYLKSIFWDWLLCVGTSFGLVVHVYSGFVLEDQYSQNMVAVLVFVAAVTFVLELFSYNKASVIAGVVAGAALLVLFLVYVNATNPFADETANSVGIFIVVTVMTALLCFLAARTRAGIIALFLAGNLVIAGSAFLQFPVRPWSLLVFLFSIAFLFFWRVWRITLMHVFTGKIRTKRFLVQMFCVCGVCFLLAAAVFGGVIRPLSPPTRELKLITKLEQMDLLRVLGVSSVKKLLDPSLRSSLLPEEILYADNAGEEENEEYDKEQEKEEEEKQQEEEDSAGANDEVDADNVQEAFAVWYDMYQVKILWSVIIIAAAVAAAFLLRMQWHRSWRRKLDGMDRESAIVNFYQFFYRRLQRCGFKRAPTHTLYEYAKAMEHEMQVLAVGDVTFCALTEVYVRVWYGRGSADEEDMEMFSKFYGSFFKNLRREIGGFRYLLKIFRI